MVKPIFYSRERNYLCQHTPNDENGEFFWVYGLDLLLHVDGESFGVVTEHEAVQLMDILEDRRSKR